MDIVQHTIDAIRITNHSSTTREQRQRCEAFLLQLKNEASTAGVLWQILSAHSFPSIPPSDTEAIFLLALSLLHEWIKAWWGKLNQGEQVEFRQMVSQLLSQSTCIPHTSRYSSQLAAILADIVERQFPQQWSSFIADIKGLWQQGPTYKQEIILKTLQFVLVDCTDADFHSQQLSAKRSQEIVAGFHDAQEDLLDISYLYFLSMVQVVCESTDLGTMLRLTRWAAF
jgi:hypothetical protein